MLPSSTIVMLCINIYYFQPVAIKRMEHKTKKQKAANFHEASILSYCHHPNIVKYFTCHEIKDELWVCSQEKKKEKE